MSQVRVCIICGTEKPMCSGFKRWDKVCVECRATAPKAPAKLTIHQRDRKMVALRNERGLTNAQIAALMGLTTEVVGNRLSGLRERGRKVDLDPNCEPGPRINSERAAQRRILAGAGVSSKRRRKAMAA